MTDYIHPGASDSRFHAEGYERLRTSATGRTQVPLRNGLAVLRNRGVVAWMCSCAAPSIGLRPPPAVPAALPPDEVVDVLLDMIGPHLAGLTAGDAG